MQTYYVYSAHPEPRVSSTQYLITNNKIHWWAFYDTQLLEAVDNLQKHGWKLEKDTWQPNKLLYSSETHPEFFI